MDDAANLEAGSAEIHKEAHGQSSRSQVVDALGSMVTIQERDGLQLDDTIVTETGLDVHW